MSFPHPLWKKIQWSKLIQFILKVWIYDQKPKGKSFLNCMGMNQQYRCALATGEVCTVVFHCHARQPVIHRWAITRVGLLEVHKMWFWESFGWAQWTELGLQWFFSLKQIESISLLYLSDAELHIWMAPKTSCPMKLDQTVPDLQYHKEVKVLSPRKKKKTCWRFSCYSFSMCLY